MIDIQVKENCCGCSACYAVCPKQAITMKEDNEGFRYPQVNSTLCVECGLCNKVCPIENQTEEKKFIQQAYLVQNRDERILAESTSGGAYSAIAEDVLEQNGIVFGAMFDEKLEVHHGWVDSKSELWRFRNSKYVQSDMREAYRCVKDFLHEGRLVLFSGTPCQVEGLYHYLGKCKPSNLLLADVVCHAVPSVRVWRAYKDAIYNNTTCRYPVFRDKSLYGYKYSNMIWHDNKGNLNYHEGVESDSYLRAFFSNICDRPSCYSCKFKKRYHISDFTMWDCFNIGELSADLDNDKGVTNLLLHTEKARKIFHELSGKLRSVPIEAHDAVSTAREMFNSVPLNKNRDKFFQDMDTLGDYAALEKYFHKNMHTNFVKFIRIALCKCGMYSFVKKWAKRILRK